MAARNWSRNGPGYVSGNIGASYLPSNMGFYPSPMERRPAYNNPIAKPYGGSGFRDDTYRQTRDDYRARGKSPISDKRQHRDSFRPSQENRSSKRPILGKYEVKVPKMPFNLLSASVPEIKLAHPHISVPGDFSKAKLCWKDEFPLYKPMKIANNTDVYILHGDVEPITNKAENVIDPSDLDYSYSVRVMLMATPEIEELYKTSFRSAEEPLGTEKTPIAKNIQFLVGGKGKLETMAIGGPWSPSLDGRDPSSNPQTLIKTAIRTFRNLTGVDLSSVTEWTRFMEIKYSRCANTKAISMSGDEEHRDVSEDKEEVVVFLIPNVSHLVPSQSEWEKTKSLYAEALEKILNPSEPEAKPDDCESSKIVDSTLDDSQEVMELGSGEPTHYSKLDPNTMKVTELRSELNSRNLDIKGVKANLITRLQGVLDEEKAANKDETSKTPEEESTKPAAASSQPKEEIKGMTEKDRRRLERLYRLGDKPSILIYPNRSARGGRFDCHRVSLHSLLNYRSEEQKESNFEVSLFVEQFHEMLQRDCAFNIFKAVYAAPEKDAKETKIELNGVSTEDSKEPPTKRRKDISGGNQDNESGADSNKSRRTIDPHLLFSFTYFDVGYSEFIRDYDLVDILHLLDLGYSKSQMKKLVTKVTDKRDHVQYRNLTDQHVIDGEKSDILSSKLESNDPEFVQDLAAGNDILFGGETSQIAPQIFIVGNNKQLLEGMRKTEALKRATEFQLFQIKNELEKTRTRLNTWKDTEDKLRNENREYQEKLTEEQKSSCDNKILVSIYNHLIKNSREKMSSAVSEIETQFEQEKAKRDAERLAAEEERAKAEAERIKEEKVDEKISGKEEKEWEVVDQV